MIFEPFLYKNLGVISFGLLCLNVQAAQIKGTVSDARTIEPLISAVMQIRETGQATSVGLDGNYVFRNLPKGNYTIICSYLGYTSQEKTVVIDFESENHIADFRLSETVNELTEVHVTGEHDKESDQSARLSEKNASNILNIMSAKTIELLPDLSVGNVLQRVAGVSMDRSSSGEGRYAIIRGMDQKYSYTLVNGIKIPSPDNKNRYVPMDIFPADLLERLEVSKTLIPSMEGDATGGAINLVMKSAPNHLTIKANAATGFSQLTADRGFVNFDRSGIQDKSPAEVKGPNYIYSPNDFNYQNFNFSKSKLPVNQLYGFSIGNKVLHNKLGFLVAGSYQSIYHATNSIFFKPDPQPTDNYQPVNNYPQFDGMIKRQISSLQNRMGLHAKLEYNLSQHHKLSLYNMFVELDEFQYRNTVDTSLNDGGRVGPGTGKVLILNRTRITKQSIYNATLRGDHQFTPSLGLNWSGVYSLANNNIPNWDEYQTSQNVSVNSNGQSVVLIPQSLSTGNDPGLVRRWTRNSDRDWMGLINLIYKKRIFGQEFEASAGGLYRDKARDNVYYEYLYQTVTDDNARPPAFDGHITPNKFYFSNSPTGHSGGGYLNPLTYKAAEKILGYYIQIKLDIFKKLEMIGGVRVENTTQSYITVEPPATYPGATGEITYTDYLPSLNTKYKINKKQNLRLSYFASINRPQFFDIIPTAFAGDNFIEYGNPYLKHAKIDNFDVRYELFPKATDQILIGAFYKNLTNPIELAYNTKLNGLQLTNFGNATNFGIEVVLTKYFGQFGISGNYTYTYSSITTPKLYLSRNIHLVDTTTQVSQNRPLQGQSPHIANLSLLYKNAKIGLDMQLAFVYTGKKISYVSPYYDNDYWQREMLTMDFSAEKTLSKHFSLYCKLQNLLNTPIIVEIHQPNQNLIGSVFSLPEQTNPKAILVQKDYIGQSYLIGLRLKL